MARKERNFGKEREWKNRNKLFKKEKRGQKIQKFGNLFVEKENSY